MQNEFNVSSEPEHVVDSADHCTWTLVLGGKALVTMVEQWPGAPFVDRAVTHGHGLRASSVVIVPPWLLRLPECRTRMKTTALVIGWIHRSRITSAYR